MNQENHNSLAENLFDEGERRSFFQGVKRAVVKVGSGVLTEEGGLNLTRIRQLATEISAILDQGREVILVSSGAVSSGMRRLGLTSRPASIREKQAVAAVGQGGLMRQYEKAFEAHGKIVAQLLLTPYDLSDRIHYLNVRNTLQTLIGWGALPIINENDSVAVEELKFGDNDNLAAMISHLMDADVFVNLTDIDGLYNKDPRDCEDAVLISTVGEINSRVEEMACALPGFLGTGGMASKVAAARKATEAGIPAVVANGTRDGVLDEIFKGVCQGTFFVPRKKRMPSKKCWIGYALKPQGTLVLDAGAARAILERGKSLLSAGVAEVLGDFPEGAAVECRTREGRVVGTGLTNYSSSDIRRIQGMKTHEIEAALGEKPYDEVIHRDNLAVLC